MFSFLHLVDATALASLLFIFYSLAHSNVRIHPNSPPVVKTYIPWLGCAVGFLFRRSDMLAHNRERYGPVYKMLVAGRYFVVVSSPKTTTNMINISPKVFQPLEETAFELLAGLAERLPYVIDLLHRTAYVFIANGLTKQSMGSITMPMNKALFELLQDVAGSSENQIRMPIEDFVSPILYRASTSAFFGTAYFPDLFSDFHIMDKGSFFMMSYMGFLSGSSIRARNRMIASLEHYVEKAWEEHNDGYVDGASSIISNSLTELRTGGITVHEVSRLLVAVLWGFNSNLIHTAIGALAYLLTDPLTYQRISTNIRVAIAEKYPDFDTLLAAEPSAIDEDEFADLDSIIQETLRICSVTASTREAMCDTILMGEDNTAYYVQKGEYILADVRGMHHDESLFSQPQQFKAERFINDKTSTKVRGVRNLRPWGGGAAVCKGREYARYTIKMFLLQTIYLFDMVPAEYVPLIEVNRSLVVARLRGSPMVSLHKRCTS